MKLLESFITLATATLALIMLQPTETVVLPAHAQVLPQQATTEGEPDSRVQEALDNLGFNYEIEESGVIKVGMRFDGDRTQVAYISSTTSTLGEMEIRTIASPANMSEGALPSEMANQLLKDNANKKLGAWQTVELQDQRHLTIFTAKIEANSSPEQLRSALYAVLTTADEMEAELNGGDRF